MVTDTDIEQLIETLKIKASDNSVLSFDSLDQRAVQREYRLMLSYADSVLDNYKIIISNPYHPDLWNRFKKAVEDKAAKKPPKSLQHLPLLASDWKNVQDKIGRFLAFAWRQDQEAKESA